MALQLRPNCEYCDRDLPPDSADARICSYECTFCVDCVETRLHNVCPTVVVDSRRDRSDRQRNGGPDCQSRNARLPISACTCPTAWRMSPPSRHGSGIFHLRSADLGATIKPPAKSCPRPRRTRHDTPRPGTSQKKQDNRRLQGSFA